MILTLNTWLTRKINFLSSKIFQTYKYKYTLTHTHEGKKSVHRWVHHLKDLLPTVMLLHPPPGTSSSHPTEAPPSWILSSSIPNFFNTWFYSACMQVCVWTLWKQCMYSGTFLHSTLCCEMASTFGRAIRKKEMGEGEGRRKEASKQYIYPQENG